MIIKIYTTDTCHYCKLVKDYFNEKGVEYTEVNVKEDTEAREEAKLLSGQLGIPVITIDDKVIIGFNREELDKYL